MCFSELCFIEPAVELTSQYYQGCTYTARIHLGFVGWFYDFDAYVPWYRAEGVQWGFCRGMCHATAAPSCA